MQRIDRSGLAVILEKLDRTCSVRSRICLLGGAAFMLLGMPGRQTTDIDIWRPASDFITGDIETGAQISGLAFDPTGDCEGPYIEIVHSGVINLPVCTASIDWRGGLKGIELWHGANLTVTCPPTDLLSARKMLRADPKDLGDVVWAIAAGKTTVGRIRRASVLFNPVDAETIRENLIYLQVLHQSHLTQPEAYL